MDMMQHQGMPRIADNGAFSRPATEINGISNLDNNVENLQQVSQIDNTTKDTEPSKEESTATEIPPVNTDLYETGQELLRQGAFMEAKQTFHQFVEQNPSSPRAANALFWAGECEYRMSRFEEAILEYQKVISKYPDSNKVPDALLKQGYAFLKLGDRESAKIVLEKLIRKYPSSPQAITARKQIKRLG
jgi:tol-pal system protein YbgF